MKRLLGILVVAAAGCAAPAPEHLLGTAGVAPDKLAVFVLPSQELRLLEVDGRALPRTDDTGFYLPPGPHRLGLALNWCPGGACATFGSFAEQPRSACITVAANARYKVSVANLGANWQPKVTETLATGESRTIESACK
jgi:hypothetical protein